METAPLKSFATWARTALIREVSARIAVVLAQASLERVEQPGAVEALEKAIATAGGGDKGKTVVADRGAYTWFNRIIALRFMDANGYTGVGVVSPQPGVESGQPEILAEAKRGNIDATVVGTKTREMVMSLLNGTRRSGDAQSEAYALLLADYCRYWNRAMPFMFEREGDFTELLIPANLLADDSVLSRAVKVLTSDACQNVEVIGWLYQFYISERKDEVFASFKKNKKAGADEIPAATQLFTPHWIVRYLVENSLGRLWMLNRPSSRLVDQMQYYIAPADEETDFLKIGGPKELKVVDPACGSGHMLTYAFDLLYAIYEEEGYAPAEIPGLILTNNLYGIEIDPRAGALAAFALTMKARAKQRMFFNKQIEPNVCVLEPIRFTLAEIDFLLIRGGDRDAESAFWNQFEHGDVLGSLIQPDPELTASLKQHLSELDDGTDILLTDLLDRAERVVLQAEYLAPRYVVVVANPPYMGSNSMGDVLVRFAKNNFPMTRSDFYNMFMERAASLCLGGGAWGIISPHGWMFQSSFADWRRLFLSENILTSLVHFGRGVFGSDWASAAFVVLRSKPDVNCSAIYRKLYERALEVRQRDALEQFFLNPTYQSFVVKQFLFLGIDGSPFAYWLRPEELAIYRDFPPLSTLGVTRQGLATGDNNRFLRYWWEVSASRTNRNATDGTEAANSKAKWFPLQKGGTPRRWAGNDEYIVDWYEDGKEIRAFGAESGGRPKSRAQNTAYYFREGATWSSLSGEFAMRFSPAGYIFETKGSMLFPSRESDLRWLLGYLNTPIARELIDSLSPTLDYHEGPVGRIPVIPPNDPTFVTARVEQALAHATAIWSRLETSPSFSGSHLRSSEALLKTRDALEADCAERLAQEDAILGIEREIEDHFRASGAVGEDAFALEAQRPTGLIDDCLRDRLAAARLLVEDFVSYAIGCMFGRYSLDEPGLILADQGATVQNYLAKVPSPTFAPDMDNVIPVVNGDWFEDDIVARFRTFLRAAFGEQHFEENLRFVTESLGVKNIRDYFVRSFYKDHVQRYKKRPIYWLFSSPKGSFNALIYMHRYTPSTVSTVLNEYLREFRAKLSSSLQQQERLAAGGGTPRQQAAAQKEADRLRKVLVELEEYEHDVLYPLASRQLAIDLDDGVKANYPKFGAALKKIAGLGASDE
ncbi:BREX-1 system adenine-specific DNA-methyltransferase PglX [Amycolatopsis sp. NPDC059021]|uniref:BREX-1 system adenine-specific DNA-methyltransferase PglX n=1 Tax=Amycolatopsis sp. NPDC059021 TaxID=3346704 RepID=UPI00366B6628